MSENCASAENAYPIMTATPLDWKYMRPIRQPLFDAEWLMPDKPCDKLLMFQRPEGQTFYYNTHRVKVRQHTYLNQEAMLDYPHEFDIYGFNYAIGNEASEFDLEMIKSGLLEFGFMGRRFYLQCPLIGMPSERRRKPVGEIIRAINIQDKDELRRIEVGIERFKKDKEALRREIDDDLLYGFLVGDEPLRIKPGVAFYVTFSWAENITVSKPVLLYAFIDGITWRPL